jgi:hypothetical protein
MMGTDGSVQQEPIATFYSFVISISRINVKPNVNKQQGGGFLLLPTAQYLDPRYSKRPEAAALPLARLSLIQDLLHQYPS